MAETIEMKSCPMCGNDAPASAPSCTCGYVFSSAQPTEAVEWEPSTTSGRTGDGWQTGGAVLSGIGAIGFAISLLMGITVDGGYGGDDIVNLGLMFQKGFVAASSLAALSLGIFCLGVGAVLKAIGRKG